MNNDICLNNTRIDDLHRNGYKIIQNPDYFCFGVDAVLLSSFAKVKYNENVLDMCTGNAIIPILLEAKTKAKHITGVEIQHDIANMAKDSINLNKLNDNITIIEGDIKLWHDYFKVGSFDVITCNPPYMQAGIGAINDKSHKSIARHEIMCNINDVMLSSNKLLKYGGRLYIVHRIDRLCDILVASRNNNLEPKFIRFVQPFDNKEANLVLIEFIKGGKSGLKTGLPLVIYNKDGSYTEEVMKIYYGN